MIQQLPDTMAPRADDAEAAVIGSMILDEAARDECVAILQVKDFFDHRCAVLFRCLSELHATGKRVDPLLAYDWLRTRQLLEEAGGAAFIAEAFRAVPTPAHAVYYARQVSAAATLRAVMVAASDMGRDAIDNQHDPDAVLQRATKRLEELSERTVRVDPETIGQMLTRSLAAIESDIACEVPPASVGTGIAEVDGCLAGGLRRKQLVILAARPGIGKTALALQVATSAAIAGKRVLLLSLEMGQDELAERVLIQQSLVDGNRVRDRSMTPDERRRLVKTAAEISQAPLLVDDRASLTMREITGMCRRARRRGGLDLLVVDYLQLLTPIDYRAPRQEQVAALSRALKLLAKEIDIPVLCLSQMSREAEKQNREPRLSDLRESGAIEQDADVVVFLHREARAMKDESGAEETLLLVAKQRNGPTGSVKLLWHKKHCMFVERAAERFREFDSWSQGGDMLGEERNEQEK
jgi:replicative DNA helicase